MQPAARPGKPIREKQYALIPGTTGIVAGKLIYSSK
jgi:hypothetical protein